MWKIYYNGLEIDFIYKYYFYGVNNYLILLVFFLVLLFV